MRRGRGRRYIIKVKRHMHAYMIRIYEYRNDGTFINFFRKEANATPTYLHARINLT